MRGAGLIGLMALGGLVAGCAVPPDTPVSAPAVSVSARGPVLTPVALAGGITPADYILAREGGVREIIVNRLSRPFGQDEGAEARLAAAALCGGAVVSGPEDRFANGAWIFPGGCA